MHRADPRNTQQAEVDSTSNQALKTEEKWKDDLRCLLKKDGKHPKIWNLHPTDLLPSRESRARPSEWQIGSCTVQGQEKHKKAKTNIATSFTRAILMQLARGPGEGHLDARIFIPLTDPTSICPVNTCMLHPNSESAYSNSSVVKGSFAFASHQYTVDPAYEQEQALEQHGWRSARSHK